MFSFSLSLQLVKQSFAVLRKDKELLLFPIISAVVELLVIASFTLPLWYLFGLDADKVVHESNEVVRYVYAFLFYFASYFVIVFFNVGLVFCAHKRLTGGDPTFREGLAFAVGRLPKILSWVLLASTVGVLMRIISEKAGLFGKIFAFLADTAWSLVTYLIVPLLVFENKGVMDSVNYSAELFKKTWGEQIKGGISMGLIFGSLMLLPVLIFLLFMFFTIRSESFYVVTMLSFLGVILLYWILLSIVSSALQGIFTAALFIYAKTGTVPTAFDPALVKDAFRKKTEKQSPTSSQPSGIIPQ
jgi:hypothetical protein